MLMNGCAIGLGIPRGNSNPKLDEMYAAANLWSGTNEMLAELVELPLEAQPQTLFSHGFQQDVKGAIIRRIIGEGLNVFLARRMFRPLQMKDTSFDARHRVRQGKLNRIRAPPEHLAYFTKNTKDGNTDGAQDSTLASSPQTTVQYCPSA